MLKNIIEDDDFALMMQRNIEDVIIYFFEKEQNFSILCKIDDVSFDPVLPESINAEFRPLTLFFMAGYTFESAKIVEDKLVFEAGFGSENIGAMVYIDISRILQIVIAENPIFINVTATAPKETPKNSMEVFASKSRNQRFFKKS